MLIVKYVPSHNCLSLDGRLTTKYLDINPPLITEICNSYSIVLVKITQQQNNHLGYKFFINKALCKYKLGTILILHLHPYLHIYVPPLLSLYFLLTIFIHFPQLLHAHIPLPSYIFNLVPLLNIFLHTILYREGNVTIDYSVFIFSGWTKIRGCEIN